MLNMPTVLRKDGFRIVIWTNDHTPMHVHIFTGDSEAVINIEDAKLVQVWDMSPRQVRQAKIIVEENRKILAEKDFEKEYDEAVQRTKEADKNEPRAKKAFYDEKSGRIVVELDNGCTFLFPPKLAEGLQNAGNEELSDVQITPSGAGLHFEKADAHFSLTGLLLGIFGTKNWMAELGKRGGSISTKATRQASRENGRRGGRPLKDKVA